MLNQGVRILLGENFQEIVCCSASAETFGGDAGLCALLTAKGVGSHAAENGQVLLHMKALGADARI